MLFFAAVLVTSLSVGTGPGLAALVASLPLAAYMFVIRAGYTVHQALFQALLYGVDGLIVVYITHLTTQRRRRLDQANVELRRLRSEAERVAAHTQEVIELAPDPFFLSNLDARFTDVNRAACRLLGYDRDELLGMRIFDIIPAEDAARLEATRLDLLEPGATIHNEWRLKRRDGTLVPVDVSANILEDGRWQAFVRDITYRKSVEAALEQAVAARDVVLGIVAHDLRNPLSLITMAANAMRRAGNEPERRDAETPEVILRAAKRMNQLIEDLLDVARVEAGQLRVEFALLLAGDLARDAVEMQRPLAEASGLTINVAVEPDVRTVSGDRRRLLQVFENLLGNAIKFTQPGGCILVRVAVKNEDVMFSVTDTGAGIAPDAVPHLFDRFWQATTRAGRLGAGLGLPITKGIVEAHAGRIGVESEVGRGTTFFFTIPASQPLAVATSFASAEAESQVPHDQPRNSDQIRSARRTSNDWMPTE